MLELKNITKVYGTASEEVKALKGISIKFREAEFVSILGASGCGKTTLLNIIGGLDRYTTGDLIINGKSTKNFKDRDWDAYRNYKVGFVFQSYNLISHQTILSNVELALTIGGISKKERKERAIKALEEVGLKDHIHKKPNQLSGGQMQRVAIARALVNNPDIILADEPTGALDTKTSVQVMEILKKISKDKLIIMVTHNPDLAKEYSSRIIKILDGNITEDSNPILVEELQKLETNKIGRTSMSFFTAFRLSLNNLLTKKGRTLLVSFAGSIGIIGIALVLAISNGFQAYVDSIEEDTLTSYPLTIMQESTDIASAILSMTTKEENNEENTNEIKEEQYISKMLANLSTNDLKSFNDYIEKNYDEVKNDLYTIQYGYSIDPIIYTIDSSNKYVKINPNDMFSSFSMGLSGMGMGSVFSQIVDEKEALDKSYEVLAGNWPKNYDEMVIVLSEKQSVSDFLLYSLGLRPFDELQDIVTKIMSGEKVEINNEPMNITYEELMNTKLKLIMPTDKYKYNEKYNVYEDMTEDEEFVKDLYEKSLDLKIVGIVTLKEGVTTGSLNPGVLYTSDLIKHIIEYSGNSNLVKKQLENDEVDVLSNTRFDSPKSNLNLNFEDLVSVDSSKLESAFNVKVDQNQIQKETEKYMADISNSITTDINPARNDLISNFNTLLDGLNNSLGTKIEEKDIEIIVDNYLNENEPNKIFKNLEEKYVVPKDAYKKMYSGLLKGYLSSYVAAYKGMAAVNLENNIPNISQGNTTNEGFTNRLNGIDTNAIMQGNTINGMSLNEMQKYQNILQNSSIVNSENVTIPNVLTNNATSLNQALITDSENNTSKNTDTNDQLNTKVDNNSIYINKDILTSVKSSFLESTPINEAFTTMAKSMVEAKMKVIILKKVGELSAYLSKSFADAFNVDQEKIAGAFKMNISEDQLKRIITAMVSKTEANQKINLLNLGYQKIDEPTYVSFYFKSFDGKEHFKEFIKNYNEKVKADGFDDKEINYTDATGILMGSVKTIVNAVTYVLIAFISISLVVSSIMIGIITYISVYERTKEIGILRAIGASKRNISSIFNAETFIIGLLSGLFGIGVTYLLIPIINSVIHKFTGNIPLNATFYISNAIKLVILSIVLTIIGGLIPAKSASKKDPVIALRTE